MRIDSWLKISEKASFPNPELKLPYLVSRFFSNHIFTKCVAIWESWLFSGVSFKYPFHMGLVFCLYLAVNLSPSVADKANELSHWSINLSFHSCFSALSLFLVWRFPLISCKELNSSFKKMFVVFYSAFPSVL